MSETEKYILETYNGLNEKGKDQLLIMLRMCSNNPDYIKPKYESDGNLLTIVR